MSETDPFLRSPMESSHAEPKMTWSRYIKKKVSYMRHLVDSSIVPEVMGDVFIFCGITAGLVAIDLYVHNIASANLPFSAAITVVVGFLLVFRTNTAYDRFWEGRKIWSNIESASKTIARLIMTEMEPSKKLSVPNDMFSFEQKAALKDLLLFSQSLLAMLRENKSFVEGSSVSLAKLMKSKSRDQLKRRNSQFSGKHEQKCDNVIVFKDDNKTATDTSPFNNADFEVPLEPLESLQKVSMFFHKQAKAETINAALVNMIQTNLLSRLTDCYHNCQRIVATPLPLAYSIHLKHILVIYCLIFPLSIIGQFKWLSVPISAVVYFIYFGVYRIALEIENPFGFDANDLPIETFIDSMEKEFLRLIEFQNSL